MTPLSPLESGSALELEVGARCKGTAALALLVPHGPHDAVVWRSGEAVSRTAFSAHVHRVARGLPSHPYTINLCQDRYHFLVSFVAALACGQTTLLPPNRAKQVITDVAEAYPDSYCLSERPQHGLLLKQHTVDLGDSGLVEDAYRLPSIEAGHIAAIAFTSGSTGKARPNTKRFGDLVLGARLAQQRFGIAREHVAALVAMVPAQHMYGLETSIMLPLVTGIAVHSGRPFFPEDVRLALNSVPAPAVLVTTPLHLGACMESGLTAWPRLHFIISATAPLPSELALQAERTFGCPVLEIYGCSEAGSVASRRTLEGDLWRLYDGMSLSTVNGACYVSGPQLPEPVRLHDRLELKTPTQFRLLGRDSDTINLAGKRASLEELNFRLKAIPGVYDGIFIVPPEVTSGVTRLMALVVAPALSTRQIMAALAKGVDPVFLPRPLLKVDSLPRNETGKLPREELLALLARLQAGA